MVDNEVSLRIGDSEVLKSCDLTEKEYALLPNTDFIMNNTFWVGTFPALTEKELSKTLQVIHTFVKEHTK
jgi:CDP-6-deoxy-D-xylo-4-hexulose-3-dehydrase